MVVNIDGRLAGKTVKDYLFTELSLSAGSVKRLKSIDSGITVNGTHVTVRYVLNEGDMLELMLDDTDADASENVPPTNLPIDIVYEDEYMIALNKSAGMPTHPSHNHHTDTLANALAYRFVSENKPFVFRAVNRLDADTSGIVLVAKSRDSACKLSKVMQSGGFEKYYDAIVYGRITSDGEIDLPIMRAKDSTMLRRCDTEYTDRSKPALTVYKVINHLKVGENECTHLKASPITGRTHQLRVHFSHKSHPILGDGLYGRTNDGSDFTRLALHCSHLAFTHPFTGERLELYAKCEFI